MRSGGCCGRWKVADARKLEHAALIVPIFGAVLIVPPIVQVFLFPIHFAGAPLIVAYLFAVWVALIMATALMARHMKDTSLPEVQGAELPARPEDA